MIDNKQTYKLYLEADMASHLVDKMKWRYRYTIPTMYFQSLLRKVEYYQNCKKGIISKIYFQFLKLKFKKVSIQLGFTIHPNNFGPGLSIAHYGSIVINENARIGNNCRIHSAVNIGGGVDGAPVIGDNVYIGPGAKIFGNIKIGDGVVIGANAVVNKNIPSNVTIAGVPAKIIKENGVYSNTDGFAIAKEKLLRKTI
jgi:serine O-acetyltransferase